MSECAGFNVPIDIIIGHFGDVYFQSITCTDADNLTRIITNKRENTKNNTYDQSIPSEHRERDYKETCYK